MKIIVNYRWSTYHPVWGSEKNKGKELFLVDGCTSLGRMQRMIREDLQADANNKSKNVFVDRILPSDIVLLDESVDLAIASDTKD